MEYTVNILFNREVSRVLLQKKSKTEFKGMLNGVGGKVEYKEGMHAAASREIREETGLEIHPEDLHWVGTLRLPHDCGTGKDEVCILHFLAATVEDPTQAKQIEDEPIAWYDVDNIIDPRTWFPPLAGDGNLKYFISQARKVVLRHAGSIQQ